uniref:Uncharacterized protein n=1 Tax=Panagrolaimus sp. JU765 TaxID=591449 RepID=A0AC34RRX2_9BILA
MSCNFCGKILQTIHATNAKKHLRKCNPESYLSVADVDGLKPLPSKKINVEIIEKKFWPNNFFSFEKTPKDVDETIRDFVQNQVLPSTSQPIKIES